jgi:plastocyanin
MRRLLGPLAALLFVASACVTGGGSNERTVLVDFSSDRYPSFFLYNFPKKIAVHPGTTLIFRQTWTGEPHTVTSGRIVSGVLASTRAWLDLFLTYDSLKGSGADVVDPENPGDATVADFAKALRSARPRSKVKVIRDAWEKLRSQGVKLPDLDHPPDTSFKALDKVIEEESNKAFEDLPFAFGEEGNNINQNIGQPCYLTRGGPPKNPKKPCAKSNQRQPVFDGRQSFYNSGIIPYQGPQGNTFRIPLAKDIEPGTYTFYCSVHGPLQATDIEVRPESADVPTQEEISRQARREIDQVATPLDQVWTDARDGRITLMSGKEKTKIRGPFAGLFSPKEEHAAINAMVPRRITVKVGTPIKWKIMGAGHTISFDVPSYFPPVQFLKDGTVRLNPMLDEPAGGAPKPPAEESDVKKVDGGTYDGSGFWSSGLTSPCPECGGSPYIEYTLRISKPGTYKYACLLHPPMVGTVEVHS